jgi:hypothetical protein
VSSQGLRIRLDGLIAGKIMPAHGYQNGGSDWCGLLPSRVLFRLVVPPLQSGVMEPYLVCGSLAVCH